MLSYPEGSPIGRAMQGFGDELSAVAERYQQQKQQQEAFDAELARRRFNGQIAQAEDEVVANAPADGGGLHDTMYGQVDPRTGLVTKPGLFDTLFDDALPKIPESQRTAFARQKEAMREAGSLRMAARQLQRRDEYEQAEWTKVDNISTSAIAQSNPKDTEKFDAIRQNGFDLIAKLRNPLARQAAEVAWRSNTAKALVQAMIAQDPKQAAEMLGAAQAGSRTKDDTAAAVGGSSAFGAPNAAAAKGDRVGKRTPDERVAQAFRDDLPQQEQAALIRQAQAANTAQQVELRTNIGLAEQNAPDAIARTGAYSGKMPGRDAFRIAYGLDKGDKRFRDFDWRADVGRQVFGMRTMPNQAIHAALHDADSGPNGSQEDQARRETTAAAVGLVMNHRRTDGGGYVSEVFPNIAAAWKAVTGGRLEDPNGYDKDAYDKAIAMSVAAQEQLGIEDPQPVPLSIIRDLSDNYDSASMYQQDINAKVSTLLAGTSGPAARAGVARQLADADLAWIMPVEAGYKPMSTRAVLASQAKGLGKAAANAGIGAAELAAKLVTLAADGNTQATLSPPDFTGAYYEPSNRDENLMMHQGSDALGWSIPWPGVGRAAVTEKGITRAIEAVGSGAAKRAEGLVANKRVSELAAEDAGTGAIRAPTGQFYSVIFEMRLSPTLYPGFSREVHYQAANESLLQTMEGETAFAQDLRNQGVNLQRTQTGLAPRTAPPDFSWHHAAEPGVMQLVPRSQHDGGSTFQETLHPDRRGGFSLWGKQ
ncbi:HNH endonuclease [Mesorhizobium sp. M0644]|uniref:HNH endonuclease n=1 Tax=unclassified Mesorhizobium TaxID=325217 RepID=UPI00333AA598